MSQVDFYLISNPVKSGKLKLACRLGNKIVRMGLRTFVYTESEAMAGELDQLMWTYSDTSFVPHERYTDPPSVPYDPMVPLVISHMDPGADCNAPVLISLATEVLPFCDRFERIAEIVGFENEDKAAARKRFQIYQEGDFTVNTHDIGL